MVICFVPSPFDFCEYLAFESCKPLKDGHCLKRAVCEDGIIYSFVGPPGDYFRAGRELVDDNVPFSGCYESGELPSNNRIRLIVSVKGD